MNAGAKTVVDEATGEEPRRPERPEIDDASPPGLIAGRYAVQSEIARGGMGVVYRVVDNSTGSTLALKRSLHRQVFAEALEREYRTLVSLRHPRIVQVHDFGRDGQDAFYTMELLDGADLRTRSPLPWREVCANLQQVASSLALLHSRRLLHRDVSAANIRLTSEGRAKLIDFGALTTFGKSTTIAGTPSGVAPEVLEGDLDHRVDLYALGATAYYALTGRHAYPAHALGELKFLWGRGAPTPPSRLVEGIPAELDEFVLSLLSLNRTLRPTSAAEVIDRFAAIAGLEAEQDDQVAQSYLMGQELVGRNKQVSRLRTALDGALSGHGGAVLVEARSGHGRTALLQQLEREGRIAGAVVLTVSARAHQRPFGLCSALAQRALTETPELANSLVKQHLPHLEKLLHDQRPARASVHPRPAKAQAPAPGLSDEATGDAFQRFLTALAGPRLVIVLVDDLHAADSHSLPVLAALAKASQQHRLLVVADVDSEDQGRSRAGITLFGRSALRLRLRPLSSEHVEEWVRTTFGEVSATKRVASWLHQQTGGSPLLCTELIAHLVKQGHIHYAEGTWVLPHEFPDEDVHAVLAAAMQAQIERLRPELRRFAESLSPHPRSLDRGLCDALRQASPELATFETQPLLTDLLLDGILIGDAGEYTFARPRVRELLYAGIDVSRRQYLHRCAARRLSEQANGDPERTFEVGRHLLLGGDRQGAADHIASSMAEIGARPDPLVRAAPQLKELYQQYLRAEHTPEELLPVTTSLVIAGYYVDPAVHDEFGNETAELLQRKTGFALAARLLPWFGSYAALFIGVLWGVAQFVWSRRWHRGQSFESIMRSFVGVCASRSAVAYLRLETGVHEFVLRLLSPAKGLHPHNALRLVYDLIALTIAESRGELGKRHAGYRDQLARLPHVKILDEARHHYEAGLLCSLGQLLLFCMGPGALECADKVDALGGQHDRVVAQFLRVSYHLFRGESVKAQAADEVLDAIAAKYGHRWIPDVLAVLDLAPYHLAADVVGLKRVLHRTERLLPIAPRFVVYRDVVRAMYEGHRGRPEVALAIYESLGAELAPFAHPAWSFAHGHRAECLNSLGRHAEALAVCRAALEQIGDLSRVYVVAYQQLEREAALALAQLGQGEEAARWLDELLQFHEHDSHPLLIGLLRRDRARVALMADDRLAFELNAAKARAEFLGTGNPSLQRQATRLAHLPQKHGQSGGKQGGDAQSSLLHSVSGLPLEAVAQHALEHIVTLCCASRGYLYLLQEGKSVLSARYGEGDDPPPLQSDVERLLASYSEEFITETTAIGAGAPGEVSTYRLVPLIAREQGQRDPVGVAAVLGSDAVDRLTDEQLNEVALVLRGEAR